MPTWFIVFKLESLRLTFRVFRYYIDSKFSVLRSLCWRKMRRGLLCRTDIGCKLLQRNPERARSRWNAMLEQPS